MNTLNEYLQNKLITLKTELKYKKKSYSDLSQIDMLSSTGNNLLNEINFIKGEIHGYEDVINTCEKYDIKYEKK